MNRIFWIIILISASLSSARAVEGELTTYIQYKKGNPIILHLDYPGGIADWDAGASIANETLILSNAMFISITNSEGEIVKSLKDKVLAVWADDFHRNPFSLTLDISKLYNLSQPGKYVLQWGCKDVSKDSISIEIVEK